MLNSFQEEQNQVLKLILNERFFQVWKNKELYIDNELEKDYSLWNNSGLELYLTNKCTQQCKYCYLVKHPELYPAGIDNSQILNNLHLIYQWILDNDFHIPWIELFSGEIWHLEFGIEVLNITLEYIKKGMKVDNFIIPTNGQFLYDTAQTILIQQLIIEFLQNGSKITISFSCDGKIVDSDNRLRPQEYTDDFYNKLCFFAKINNFFIQSMLTPNTVSQWKENYLWWEKQCAEFDMSVESTVKILEERNNDWDDESVHALNDFLDFRIRNYIDKYCNGDIELFTRQLFNLDNEISPWNDYLMFELNNDNNTPACTISQALFIRVGDLSIIPCHRLAYDRYLYGKLVVNDNKIVDITENNLGVAIRILAQSNIMGSMKCDICKYKDYCIKGCFGQQYEEKKDPFLPVNGVCNLMSGKYSFLISLYKELGVFEYLKQYRYLPRINKLFDFAKEIGNAI